MELALQCGFATKDTILSVDVRRAAFAFAQAVEAECVPNLAAECSKESERLRYCYDRVMESLIIPIMAYEEWIIATDAAIDHARSKS